MKKLMGASAILTALAILVIAAVAVATPASGVTSTALAQGSLAPIDVNVQTGAWKLRLETQGQSDLSVTEIRVAPGGHLGWHIHPGPSLVIVKSGASTFYRGDDPSCTPQVYRAGSAYVDPGGVVHIARNEGSEELVVLATRLGPSGVAPRSDAPDPGNCGSPGPGPGPGGPRPA